MTVKFKSFVRWTPALVTWAVVFAVLLLILLAGTTSSEGIENSNSGGNTAAFVLFGIATLPLFVKRIRFRTKKWFPWLVGGLSATVALLLPLSSLFAPPIASWSIYGGLQVLKASQPFNDLAWVFRWAACEGCIEEFPGYGSGVLWIKPLSLGLIAESWALPIGFLMIAVLSVTLAWLAKSSEAGALPIYFLVAVGSSWLLLLDRANVDGFVFLAVVVAVLIFQRSTSIWPWTLLAAGIWWMGTWKLYPFALGFLLVPLLFIKRGWLVLAGFVAATLAYIAMNMDSRIEGFQGNQLGAYLNDFPAFGRIPIISRMSSEIDLNSITTLPSILIFLMAICAIGWGWRFSRESNIRDFPKALLALGGSGIFLANTLFGGFGFGYKGAFLVLVIPLMAIGLQSANAFSLYTSIVSLILIGLSIVLAYSILLTSIASILVASLAAGAGLEVYVRKLRQMFRRKNSVSMNA